MGEDGKLMANKNERVITYTATTVYVYESMTSCARAFGISRKTLKRLIRSGSTWDDGITTFDIPCNSDIDLPEDGSPGHPRKA